MFLCVLTFGQTFETASVKRAVAGDRVRTSMRGGPGSADPGQITFTSVTLMNVLLRAYDVKSFQAVGPDWLNSERYDVLAKVPEGTSKEQCNLMLQHLLAERFHLSAHQEKRQLQGYELVVGKSGSKLKASSEIDEVSGEEARPPKVDANGFPQLEHPGIAMMEGIKGKSVVTFLTARAQTLAPLVERLSREFRLPILDKTGLPGKYDFKLEFAPEAPGAISTNRPELDDSAPNLITAVQQQLGLKLTPSKVPTDVVVVDRADRVPVEN